MPSGNSDTTRVLSCKCVNAFQDERYGKKMRVHAWREKKNVWRCTVCQAEKS